MVGKVEREWPSRVSGVVEYRLNLGLDVMDGESGDAEMGPDTLAQRLVWEPADGTAVAVEVAAG